MIELFVACGFLPSQEPDPSHAARTKLASPVACGSLGISTAAGGDICTKPKLGDLVYKTQRVGTRRRFGGTRRRPAVVTLSVWEPIRQTSDRGLVGGIPPAAVIRV